MRELRFSLVLFFLLFGLSVYSQAQIKTEDVLLITFEIDPSGDGKKIEVDQVLKRTGISQCHVEFKFQNGGYNIRYQDECALFPLPLEDMGFCRAEIVNIGKANALDYIAGVGATGIQSHKRLILDPFNNRVIAIQYAEGGASGLEESKSIEKGKYFLPLLESSYILRGYQGYGPSQYSGYIVEISDRAINVFHILNPVAKLDSESERPIERFYSPDWCKFFLKRQMEEYQDVIKTGIISKEGKKEVQEFIFKTKQFCNVKKSHALRLDEWRK